MPFRSPNQQCRSTESINFNARLNRRLTDNCNSNTTFAIHKQCSAAAAEAAAAAAALLRETSTMQLTSTFVGQHSTARLNMMRASSSSSSSTADFHSATEFGTFSSAVSDTTTPQPFYGPFSGTTQVSRCQKKACSGLYGAREDNKWQTHRQSGLAPLHPDQSAIHLHQSSHFYARCLSCHNPPNLSWLATGTGICWIAYLRSLVLCQTQYCM